MSENEKVERIEELKERNPEIKRREALAEKEPREWERAKGDPDKEAAFKEEVRKSNEAVERETEPADLEKSILGWGHPAERDSRIGPVGIQGFPLKSELDAAAASEQTRINALRDKMLNPRSGKK